MHTKINNIKKFFNIKNSLNIFIILILFTFNYITLNSKFLLKANTTEKTSTADDILAFLKDIKSKPEIAKNSSLSSQCDALINEYDQIKKAIYTFFNENTNIQQLKLTLFDKKDEKISSVRNQINSINDMVEKLPNQDNDELKTNSKELSDSITEYLNIIENDLIENALYLQNTKPEEVTIDLLTNKLTKFQEIYNNVEDKTENIRKLISSILGLTMREHLADIKNGIDQLKTAIDNIYEPVEEQLIKEKIIDKATNYKQLSLDTIIKQTFNDEFIKLTNLKDEINQVINTDNNSNTNTNNSDNDNFKLSSDNNSSLATKLFYLLCVIITITFLLIIYQFNKKPQHKNHL
ncbi:MAG: hypothetical protein Q8800_00825 [Candidatus Phytoplasma australasiaticum]|uniref:hypothetical protein n=1 Tax=Candidatus Phytoplasma australasiaticum TaxID=2754999 RepID=UPI0027122202|nr:hypothetical protein [Candidatus Phytoplasma australasiaticum]MDO8053516.1 hypothetical protein [Candidatus Phytoplasma australasiaticum]MDO8059563.1 hypothetical protein [Candidatus Phytoplasma australasiaticum]MDV3137881.1 hypothetical protein [Candidatus Phytoplasma australasiaticum]MDV3147701.1 hypothetical protein [Candidatus Phytoplasma australasiaticum]MDV3149703.1 hypothetical protein [Candidatus Phytoplasma australasiaticum]